MSFTLSRVFCVGMAGIAGIRAGSLDREKFCSLQRRCCCGKRGFKCKNYLLLSPFGKSTVELGNGEQRKSGDDARHTIHFRFPESGILLMLNDTVKLERNEKWAE